MYYWMKMTKLYVRLILIFKIIWRFYQYLVLNAEFTPDFPYLFFHFMCQTVNHVLLCCSETNWYLSRVRPWSKARQCGRVWSVRPYCRMYKKMLVSHKELESIFTIFLVSVRTPQAFHPLYLTSIWPWDCAPEAYFPQKEHSVNRFCIVSCQWLIVRWNGSCFV